MHSRILSTGHHHRESDIEGPEHALAACAAGLSDARQMRDAIVLALGLLNKMDSTAADVPDAGTLAELRDLFDDIASFGAAGSQAIQRATRAIGQVPDRPTRLESQASTTLLA